jgi:hypothetical protein
MADRIDDGGNEQPRPEDREEQLPEADAAKHNEDDLEGELPETDAEDVEGGDEDELEKARERADPARGDRDADGGDRVSTHEGGNPQE